MGALGGFGHRLSWSIKAAPRFTGHASNSPCSCTRPLYYLAPAFIPPASATTLLPEMAANNQLRRNCACHACRRGKLKCTGERPICNNCKRKPVPQCTYDHPPGDEIWIAYSGRPNQSKPAPSPPIPQVTQANNPPMEPTIPPPLRENSLPTENTLVHGIYEYARQNPIQAPVSFAPHPPVGPAYGGVVRGDTGWAPVNLARPDILLGGDLVSGAFPYQLQASGLPQSFSVNAPEYPGFMPQPIYHSDVQGMTESYTTGVSYGEARVPRSVYPTPWI